MTHESIKNKAIKDLEEHGLAFALHTIAREASSEELEHLTEWLIEEFLKRKGDSIISWTRDDFEGVERILKDFEIPLELRMKIFKTILDFYIKTKEHIARQLSNVGSSSDELGKIARGLIILIENFNEYVEVKRPEDISYPSIKPPTPKPSDEILNGIVDVLEQSKQVILIGPPGTGKTHLAMWSAYIFTGEGKNGLWFLIQFHRNYRYEDFIERIILKPHGKFVELEFEPQIFVELCRYAEKNPDKKVVLVIDEINRADVASVFGELIYAIEYRGYPVKLTYSGQGLRVPDNLYIIATANDIDRGTFDIGVALRRRFEVIRIDSSEEDLKSLLTSNKAPQEVIDLAIEIFSKVNEFFEDIIGKKGLGHLFFKDVKDVETLEKVWKFRIKPLIEAYFYAPAMMRKAQDLIKDVESKLNELRGGRI